MKSSRRISTFSAAASLLVLILVALPAGATPPEELEVTATIYFDVASGTMHGSGTWLSEGFIDSSGVAQEDHFVAGWPPGYIFKTAHLTETWEDEYLDKIDKELKKTFDINMRYRAITEDINIVKENLELFKDLMQHQHSSMLEWIIIILILVEVVNMIIEKLF